MEEQERPPAWQLALAFAALYIIWGSTYLAIKVAIETMPPLLMAGTRFVLAGGILVVWALARGAPKPSWEQWRHALIVGALLIAAGNGIVTLAELWIDSSMAALIIASNPLFMTLFGWWGGVQRRPGWMSSVSLGIGFVGVFLLISGSEGMRSGGDWPGYLLTLCAILFWTIGSIFSKRHPESMNPWLQSGMQMICGGVVCLVAAAALGEPNEVIVGAFSQRSMWAFFYLIVFGSLAGYTSYVFLLRHCAPTTVSSHAYINPVVAAFFGWLMLGETLTPASLAGSALVIVAVFALLRRSARRSSVSAQE